MCFPIQIKFITFATGMRKKSGLHTVYLKNTLTVLLVLFSLTPCIVKESALRTIEISYNKPLNKAKSTSDQIFCQSFDTETEQAEALPVKKINAKIPAHSMSDPTPVSHSLCDHPVPENYDDHPSAPPKYILFKRLKIAEPVA